MTDTDLLKCPATFPSDGSVMAKFFLRKLPITDRRAYIIASLIVLLLLDVSRLPQNQVSAKFLLFSIGTYRRFVSPKIRGFVVCKFQPTCSQYAYTSIEWYGTFWGGIRTVKRLLRCSPWSGCSGWDPP